MSNFLKRFSFGKNWAKYSELVDPVRIAKAQKHLQARFNVERFEGNFIDIGCGSGVFAAAATKLNARVTAFDYDVNSVETSRKVIEKFGDSHNLVSLSQGDVLSDGLGINLGNFDYIYSWGVLHHTGEMWKAISKISGEAKAGCVFVMAIYNDMGEISLHWKKLKKLYVNFPPSRPIIIAYAWYRFWAKQQFRSLLTGNDPFKSWREYSIDSRGMSAWYDLIDWAGGYPYEYATPSEIINFMTSKGWICTNTWRNYGIGCNEFTFQKLDQQ